MKIKDVKMRNILFVTCFLFSFSTPLFAKDASAYPSPKGEMQSTLDELVTIVTGNPGDENLSVRREKMHDVIAPRFDFREMAKRSLGAKWKSITTEEQEEFVSLFSDLLARTYLGRIENVEKDMVSVNGEKIKFPRALVKTMVDYKGDQFPIDYKLLHSSENGWRVYDVIIENIGLVSNYRNEFSGILRKEKFPGLINRLKEKNDNAKS